MLIFVNPVLIYPSIFYQELI